MGARLVEPEFLDSLAPDDPRAIHSRRDLRLCNALMFQSAIMMRLLTRICVEPPRSMVDIGSGDGLFALSIARRLARRWPEVSLTLVDRQNSVSDATLAAFASLSWRAERVSADVFDFFASPGRNDLVTANLFLHHFEAHRLSELLTGISRSTRVFVATEPRRDLAAALGCRFLPLFGCNDVTRHDAAASIRAGFRDRELSALWPRGWSISEQRALPFSHSFAAKRTGAGP
jgi:2-polyprenyl-3-methyl-5-hydroxy-6-metoxy-1,4-benzoquinol methylase